MMDNEREEEQEHEVIGVQDLQTRRKSSQLHQPTHKNIKSSSSISSESSSFEYSQSMDIDNTTTTTTVSFTHGEKHKIITSVIEVEGDKPNFEEPNNREIAINVAHNGESNGFTKELNGDGVVEYPLPKINGGKDGVVEYPLPEINGKDEETENGAITSGFSNSQETAVGLKYVESLLDESSNGVNGTTPEIYNADNIVNKTLIVNGQSEIVEANGFHEVELEAEEYDVETVIRKQETHYLICPHCNHDITKRVILRRRKRKIGQISEGAEDSGIKPGPTAPSSALGEDLDIEKRKLENESSQVKGAPDGSIDAISCFSCFSIFVSKEDGFLWWRFQPKPAVTLQTDDSLAVSKAQAESANDDETGKEFPFWILTCCQPYHTEKPVPKPDSKFPLTSEDELPPSREPVEETPLSPMPELPAPVTPGKETPLLPMPELPALVTPDKGENSLPWILTCCQPSEDRTKPEHAPRPGTKDPISKKEAPTVVSDGLPVDPTLQTSTLHDPETPSVHKHLTPIKPVEETTLPPQEQPLVTPDEEKDSSLWFLTCCQPGERKIQKRPEKPDKPFTSTQPSKTPDDDTISSSKTLTSIQPANDNSVPHVTPLVTPAGGTAIQHHGGEPSSLQSGDAATPVPPTPLPPVISEPWKTILPKPLIKPDDDIPSPPEPEAPPTPPKGEVTGVSIAEEQPIPQTLDTLPDTYGSGPRPDIEQPLLEHPIEPSRAGVRTDIIKSIVYGGLLECITSLSVIASAAGGDATTLNIVALGLANVFGGLLVLLHNLRVLKHEHATERYEDQLGRPGHFLLHAIIAVISYLVFGLMSPIIYGFTFRKSDYKDYKLATLAASSLLCITILSIGKAYVQRPPKAYLQTIFYYISMGFMASGATYVAGDLISAFLKKLGVFESRAAPAAMTGTWSSY